MDNCGALSANWRFRTSWRWARPCAELGVAGVSKWSSDLWGTHFDDSAGFLRHGEGMGVRHSLNGPHNAFAGSDLRGATEERLPTGRRFFINWWSAFFPEGSALCGSPAENLGELAQRPSSAAATPGCRRLRISASFSLSK